MGARSRAAVFDAYGTLLDVHAAMGAHAAKLPPDWERISQEWRQKQLEYTWVRSLTGPSKHRDFWQITQDALAFVAARHRITDPATRAALLELLSPPLRLPRCSRCATPCPRARPAARRSSRTASPGCWATPCVPRGWTGCSTRC